MALNVGGGALAGSAPPPKSVPGKYIGECSWHRRLVIEIVSMKTLGQAEADDVEIKGGEGSTRLVNN